MPLVPIDSLSDPRVAPYRNLKDRELAADGGRFIAEGEHVTRRLLESDFSTESLLIARRKAEGIAPLVRDDAPVYVASDELLAGVVGFKFHSGVLACGRRRASPTIDEVFTRVADPNRVTLVICPEVINTDNLGSLIRIAAAFGADAMALGERSCDPFWRRSIRVSMGAVFKLPIVRSEDLLADLGRLREAHGVELIAAVTDADAEPLERVPRPPRVGLLFGSESQGLQPRWVRACDRRATVPMQLGADSLNVAVAAAVFLYHFTRVGG